MRVKITAYLNDDGDGWFDPDHESGLTGEGYEEVMRLSIGDLDDPKTERVIDPSDMPNADELEDALVGIVRQHTDTFEPTARPVICGCVRRMVGRQLVVETKYCAIHRTER